MSQTQTNANLSRTASIISDSTPGRFVGIINRKRGQERGKKGAKVRYGDDLVHAVGVAGFKYGPLVERSLKALYDIDPDEVVAECAAKGIKGWVRVWKKGDTLPVLQAVADEYEIDTDGLKKAQIIAALQAVPEIATGMKQVAITREHIVEAKVQLRAQYRGRIDGTAVDVNADVMETLVVEGKKVRGYRVYVGEPKQESVEAFLTSPIPGTINLQMLQVGYKVLEDAMNGPVPASKSNPVSEAKKVLERRIPVGRYKSYRLEPHVVAVVDSKGNKTWRKVNGDEEELQDGDRYLTAVAGGPKITRGGGWVLKIGSAAAEKAKRDAVKVKQDQVDEAIAILSDGDQADD